MDFVAPLLCYLLNLDSFLSDESNGRKVRMYWYMHVRQLNPLQWKNFDYDFSPHFAIHFVFSLVSMFQSILVLASDCPVLKVEGSMAPVFPIYVKDRYENRIFLISQSSYPHKWFMIRNFCDKNPKEFLIFIGIWIQIVILCWHNVTGINSGTVFMFFCQNYFLKLEVSHFHLYASKFQQKCTKLIIPQIVYPMHRTPGRFD